MAGWTDKPVCRSSFLAWVVLLCLWFASSLFAAVPERTLLTDHFVIRYGPALARKAPEVAKAAESAYREVTARLGLAPPGRIPLHLYGRHRDFRKAANVHAYDLVVGTSETDGGLIRLDASGAFSNPERTLRHEIVHSVLARGLGPRVHVLPLWMNEGLAQYLAQPDDPVAEERVRQARGEGTFRPLYELENEFSSSGGVDVAYAEAYSAVAFFMRLYGPEAMRRYLDFIRQGKRHPESFRTATGDDLIGFYEKWGDSLVRRGWTATLQMFYYPAITLAMLLAMWMAYVNVVRRRRAIEEEDEGEEGDDGVVHDREASIGSDVREEEGHDKSEVGIEEEKC